MVAGFEFNRCQILKTGTRTDVVVVATPDFDHDAGLDTIAEPLRRQTLVAELAVEALVVAVLPKFARVDERSLHLCLCEPIQDRVADEFGPVVRTQEPRRTVLGDQAREHFDHAGRTDRAPDIDRQTFASEFVDDGQAFETLPIGAGVEHEVVGPNVVGAEGGQWLLHSEDLGDGIAL